MSSSFSFNEIVDSVYDRVDDLAVIVPSLSDVRLALDLDSVHSCVAIGCGSATLELLLLEHCMQNISEFVAVEPDSASTAVLKTNLAKCLPHATHIIHQETVQSWQHVGKPFDAALLIHLLYFLKSEDRLALCRKLFNEVLCSGGFVFILFHPHHSSGEPSAFCRVIQQLKSCVYSDELITDVEVRNVMASVGFELCYEKMYECHLNVENLDDEFLSLFQSCAGDYPLELIRQTAEGVFGCSKQVRHDSWLGVFRKP